MPHGLGSMGYDPKNYNSQVMIPKEKPRMYLNIKMSCLIQSNHKAVDVFYVRVV